MLPVALLLPLPALLQGRPTLVLLTAAAAEPADAAWRRRHKIGSGGARRCRCCCCRQGCQDSLRPPAAHSRYRRILLVPPGTVVVGVAAGALAAAAAVAVTAGTGGPLLRPPPGVRHCPAGQVDRFPGPRPRTRLQELCQAQFLGQCRTDKCTSHLPAVDVCGGSQGGLDQQLAATTRLKCICSPLSPPLLPRPRWRRSTGGRPGS